MRRVCYVTGTRADFGLMRATLLEIDAHPDLQIDIFATGMHLSPEHGDTIQEVLATGLRVRKQLQIPMSPATGGTMALGVGAVVQGLTESLEEDRPDVVLLLGDRGEMLAGAIAALYLNIPVAHIHGGERSGTVDEPVRHAISKLSHWHFATTVESRERLVKMGEAPENVHVTGAPGLDDIGLHSPAKRDVVLRRYGLDAARPAALLIFHPVVQQDKAAPDQISTIIGALKAEGVQVLALMPNADAGSDGMRQALQDAQDGDFILQIHLPRSDLLDAMAGFDLMIGNSSAGIIEAASFGIPVINVGIRQALRERNLNVTDVAPDQASLRQAVSEALGRGRYPHDNRYGTGSASRAIAALLASKPIDEALLNKANRY